MGGVLHILHNNPCHPEMCVDSWPTFTTAIVTVKNRWLIGTKKTYGLLQSGLLMYMYRFSSSSSSSSGMIPDICTVYTKNPDTLRSLLLNERVLLFTLSLPGRNLLPLPISILEKSHAELVDTHLPYGGSQESLDHKKTPSDPSADPPQRLWSTWDPSLEEGFKKHLSLRRGEEAEEEAEAEEGAEEGEKRVLL
ncbi:hypothetical protein F7725_000585 [Dissostichus mawsoni]|uniref:Uncharacterized protein n=1 Tax=Dissostichus mawsoni TaxID=36200 RepID=A0A7J5ZFE2_DISMA|nr:hypothetical protein F7725_000585 [Dissostichus mawsoni]